VKETTKEPAMTLAIITNILFAAFVLFSIVGLLAWAIRTSRSPVTRVQTSGVREWSPRTRDGAAARSRLEYQA
jgi:hypothetical protein